MTAPTKTRGPELPLDTPATPSTGALVKTGEPSRALPAIHADENGNISPSQLIMAAIDRGIPAESLEKLVALQERMEDRSARKEFARAMAAFQAECPPIGKNKTAEITTKAGGKYKYQYAPLDEIVHTVKPLLIKHEFSYGWDSKVESGSLTCVCTLSHISGHSTSASFTLPVENPSAMSPQQKVGAALTFAQRKTLESVLGLNTTEEDTDAVAREVDPTPISDDQLTHLEDLITETKVDRVRFLKYLAVEDLAKLPAARYKEAVAALEQKKERAK